MEFDAAADELYGLPPEQFTGRRGQLAKQAVDGGDRELAGRIVALARPTVPAWLANRLVRERGPEIRSLLEVGASLREATANRQGARLTQLSQRGRQAVDRLVEQAVSTATAEGRRVSKDAARSLAETLRAALADPRAAAQLASARLTHPLTHVGFPAGADEVGPVRPPAAGARPAAPDASDHEHQVRQARDAIMDGRRDAERAAARLEELEGELRAAGDRVARLAAEVGRLDRRLAEASSQHADAERAQQEVHRERDHARLAVRETERRLRDATDRLDRLVRRSSPPRAPRT